MFVRSVLGFSKIFRFDNLHICDIELIHSIYAVIKMFTHIETGTVLGVIVPFVLQKFIKYSMHMHSHQ